jgi:hypothetical protein
MEIRIDTNKDSKEDIRKAIDFLRAFAGQESSAPAFDIPSDTAGSVMNIFSGDVNPGANPSPDKKKSSSMDDNGLEIIPY